MKFIRTFLKSRYVEQHLPFCAALLLFALPFLILTPQKAVQKQEREDKHASYVLDSAGVRQTELKYLLKYQDPKSFLFAPDSLGFGFFRTLESAAAIQAPPTLLPEFNLPEPPQPMMPTPLPRGIPAFRTPLMPPPPASSGDAVQKEQPPAPERLLRYPVLVTADGSAIPLAEDDSSGLSETAVRQVSPRGPTILFIQKPAIEDMPWTALLMSSSGMPHLDGEALRRVSILLLDPAFRRKAGEGRLTVYWIPPETELRTSGEGHSEEKEPVS